LDRKTKKINDLKADIENKQIENKQRYDRLSNEKKDKENEYHER
jgi:hypothetical protein